MESFPPLCLSIYKSHSLPFLSPSPPIPSPFPSNPPSNYFFFFFLFFLFPTPPSHI